MGKNVNTTVVCYGCNKPFKTEVLKHPSEVYSCPKCGHKHMAEDDEADGGWVHCEYYDYE